jgi:hypothetical protein
MISFLNEFFVEFMGIFDEIWRQFANAMGVIHGYKNKGVFIKYIFLGIS